MEHVNQKEMWFVVAKKDADAVDFDDQRPLMDPSVFDGHPNTLPIVEEFLCIRLTLSQLEAQSSRIRICSYRWSDPATSDRGHTFPSNYGWFLKHIAELSLIGWVDFMSNICVGLPSSVTVSYMGMLYARFDVCPEYLLDPSKIGEAMTRGWIFQESAFGALDRYMVTNIATALSKVDQAKQCQEETTTYFYICMKISELMDRRGYGVEFAKAFQEEEKDDEQVELKKRISPWTEWFPPYTKWEETLQKFGDHAQKCYDDALAMEVNPDYSFCLQHVVYNAANMTREDLTSWLCNHLNEVATGDLMTVESFFDRYCLSLVQAYLGSQLTDESDRDVAVTSVAIEVLSSISGGPAIKKPQHLLSSAWEYLFRYTVRSRSSQWMMAQGNNAYFPYADRAVEVVPRIDKFKTGKFSSSYELAINRGAQRWFRTRLQQCEVLFGCPQMIDSPVFAIVCLKSQSKGYWAVYKPAQTPRRQKKDRKEPTSVHGINTKCC